jgi:hypothetical protein
MRTVLLMIEGEGNTLCVVVEARKIHRRDAVNAGDSSVFSAAPLSEIQCDVQGGGAVGNPSD